ncbi:MAG TPA: manganese efflux pump [Candidatus Merdenecus merdavium]|nr:manganese efflux pump [Candidatus Merdenecus merdavium]
MNVFDLLLLAVGLAMDAFAVAICKGLCMKKMSVRKGFLIALFFGGFQGFMPFLGWSLGRYFKDYITSFDHWIAFILLGLLGINMLKEGLSKDESKEELECPIDGEELSVKELFFLAVATSIDALAVGVTFAFLQVSIVSAISLIGVITFIISFAGVYIGNYFGAKLKSKAEITGGIILILMGFKILLEHLEILTIF